MALVGIEMLTPKNHSLYRRVQHLVRLNRSWEYIAEDVGLVGPRAVQELCDWVLAYKEPKNPVYANGAYIGVPNVQKKLRPEEMTARFLAWKKQKHGAQVALREIEFSQRG